jgi:FKBP-type peptidyl-prolyl cis-trans isomerase
MEREDVKGSLMEMNKQFYDLENEEITRFIDSTKWQGKREGTGIGIRIIKEGNGEKVALTDDVTISYSIKMLDGTTCDKLTKVVKTINLEKGEMIMGMREAILGMTISETSEFIIPSYMAYGVVGFPKCIPGWTPIICEITLIDSNKRL